MLFADNVLVAAFLLPLFPLSVFCFIGVLLFSSVFNLETLFDVFIALLPLGLLLNVVALFLFDACVVVVFKFAVVLFLASGLLLLPRTPAPLVLLGSVFNLPLATCFFAEAFSVSFLFESNFSVIVLISFVVSIYIHICAYICVVLTYFQFYPCFVLMYQYQFLRV